jgi:hypothetical protein
LISLHASGMPHIVGKLLTRATTLLYLISIGGLHTKLCAPKVAEVLTLGISGLPFGSPKTKCHLGVGPMAKHRIYYKGEGGGFPSHIPNSLRDSNVNPKQKIAEEQRAGAHSLARNTLKGFRGVLELRDGTRKSDKQFSYSLESVSNQPTRWLVLCWSTFGAKTTHGWLWTHKTHHGLNSREATTFPHIIYFSPLREGYIQIVFCPGTPEKESRNCQG